MKHSPGFLKLVNDAKSRVKEADFRDIKRRLDARERLVSWMCARKANGRTAICRAPCIWARA